MLVGLFYRKLLEFNKKEEVSRSFGIVARKTG